MSTIVSNFTALFGDSRASLHADADAPTIEPAGVGITTWFLQAQAQAVAFCQEVSQGGAMKMVSLEVIKDDLLATGSRYGIDDLIFEPLGFHHMEVWANAPGERRKFREYRLGWMMRTDAQLGDAYTWQFVCADINGNSTGIDVDLVARSANLQASAAAALGGITFPVVMLP